MVKGVESSSKDSHRLSNEQKEILTLLTKEYIPPKKIAIRRKTSITAVYKVIKKLRKKGLITRSFTRGLKNTGWYNPPLRSDNIRLHNQQFRCKILIGSQLYDNVRKRKTLMTKDSHIVRLCRESLIISCNELKHFYGTTPHEAMEKSIGYWLPFISQLEDRLKITIIKGENTQIKQFNSHFSEVGNELAKDANKKKYRIKIFGDDDNKLWFTLDQSWNMDEAETVHPEDSETDMQAHVQPFFNGLRRIDGYTPQFVMNAINSLIEDRKYYAENLKSHVKAIRQLGEGVKALKYQIKRVNNKLSQKKLGDFI